MLTACAGLITRHGHGLEKLLSWRAALAAGGLPGNSSTATGLGSHSDFSACVFSFLFWPLPCEGSIQRVWAFNDGV